MLTFWAIFMIVVLISLLMHGRIPAIAVLVLVPLVFGIFAGFGVELGAMMLQGMVKLAPTGIMLAFAIFYFGLMVDAGLFDPLVRAVLKVVNGDPVKIVTASAVLALVVSIDGNGATSYLICASALMPLYRRIGLDPVIFAGILLLAVSVTHTLPWAGPTARLSIALGVDVSDVIVPLIPTMLIGGAAVIALAYYYGLKERRRLGQLKLNNDPVFEVQDGMSAEAWANPELKRPRAFPFNLVLTIGLLVALVEGSIPLSVLFIAAAGLALWVNYPVPKDQRARFAEHAPTIFRTVSLTFASGAFVGVLNGTGMTDAISNDVTQIMPPAVGPYLVPIAGVLGWPFEFFATNDAYFFGILTVLTKTAGNFGIEPVEMARAAALSSPITLLNVTAASTQLLISLTGIDYGRLLRFTFVWALALSTLLLVAAFLTQAIPFIGR